MDAAAFAGLVSTDAAPQPLLCHRYTSFGWLCLTIADNIASQDFIPGLSPLAEHLSLYGRTPTTTLTSRLYGFVQARCSARHLSQTASLGQGSEYYPVYLL